MAMVVVVAVAMVAVLMAPVVVPVAAAVLVPVVATVVVPALVLAVLPVDVPAAVPAVVPVFVPVVVPVMVLVMSRAGAAVAAVGGRRSGGGYKEAAAPVRLCRPRRGGAADRQCVPHMRTTGCSSGLLSFIGMTESFKDSRRRHEKETPRMQLHIFTLHSFNNYVSLSTYQCSWLIARQLCDRFAVAVDRFTMSVSSIFAKRHNHSKTERPCARNADCLRHESPVRAQSCAPVCAGPSVPLHEHTHSFLSPSASVQQALSVVAHGAARTRYTRHRLAFVTRVTHCGLPSVEPCSHPS